MRGNMPRFDYKDFRAVQFLWRHAWVSIAVGVYGFSHE